MKSVISNAFTTIPVQDKFGSMGFPSNGLTKLEYFSLEIYKTIYKEGILPETLIKVSVMDATKFLESLEEIQKNILNEKESKPTLIQS
jgi:hypothetical protein